MPIDSICTGCNRTLRVADEYAGQEAQCPACATIYVVPAPHALPTSSGFAEQPPRFSGDFQALFYAITPSGTQYGPVDATTLARWGREGRLNATCHVLREQTSQPIPFADWMSTYSQFIRSASMTGADNSPLQSNTAPNANAFGSIPTGYSTSTLDLPPGRGVLILVLAVASWVFCITFIGSIPLAAAALYMGFKDIGAMNRHEMSDKDRVATWIGIWLAGLNVVAISAFFLILVVSSV